MQLLANELCIKEAKSFDSGIGLNLPISSVWQDFLLIYTAMGWQDLGARRLKWTDSLSYAISIEQYCTKSAIERALNREPENWFQTLVCCLLGMLSTTCHRAFAIAVLSVKLFTPFLLSWVNSAHPSRLSLILIPSTQPFLISPIQIQITVTCLTKSRTFSFLKKNYCS